MILLTMVALVIGPFAGVNNILQAHADDNNGNDQKKPCNDRHSPCRMLKQQKSFLTRLEEE
jgi:hypothetical protein